MKYRDMGLIDGENNSFLGNGIGVAPNVMLFLDTYEEYDPEGDIYDV